jgi:hypothetical protein
MTTICPDCGARHEAGSDCQSIFDQFLALEFTDPGYGSVHMLTVACFYVQHNRYSDKALKWMLPKIRAYLDENLSGTEIRRIAAADLPKPTERDWKVKRAPGEPPPFQVNWSMTIADVAAGYTDAESYCALIRQWARSIIDEVPPLDDSAT